MNIVDLIAGQLSGDVLGKLGGLVGASEQQTSTAAKSVVPALLQVFGKLASSKTGADRLSGAIGGLDLSTLGNLAGLFGGGDAGRVAKSGGDLLGSLLGGGNLSSIVGAIAAFLGSQPDMIKKLVSYLAPVVLGMVAKQLGGRPDAAGVQRLFSEQAANISAALPRGLSLGDLGSLVPGGATGPRGQEPAAAGAPGWLLPLLALAALGVGGYLWMNREQPAGGAAVVEEKVEAKGDVVVDEKTAVVTDGKSATELDETTVSVVPGLGDALKEITGVFGGLTSLLGGVKDGETAKAALPKLEEMLPTLDSLRTTTGKLPEEGKKAVAALVGEQMAPLQKLIDTVLGLPGVKEALGEKLTALVEILKKLGS